MNPNYVARIKEQLTADLDDCPNDLLTLYTLLALTKGTGTTLEDVHDAWAVWKNETMSDHKSLILFDELTADVQEMDRPYMEAIHQAVFLASDV